MSIEILSAETLEESAWESYVATHPEATVYHTPNWTKVLTCAFGFQPHHLFAEDDGVVRGFLPLFTKRGRSLCSSPFRDRGGLLADSADVAKQLLAAATVKSDRLGCVGVEIKQYFPVDDGAFAECDYEKVSYWVRSVIELPNDPDILWHNIDNKVRGKVRQATKHGVTFEIEDCPDAHSSFYDLFWQTRRTLGVPCYGPEFFELISEELVPKRYAHFFFATGGGERLAGMLVLTFGKTVIDAYAASRREDLEVRPNDFLVWSVIRWAVENGYEIFDFGADAPHLDSLLQFKAKWLAKQDKAAYYYKSRKNGRKLKVDPSAGFLSGIAKKVFPNLPAPFYKGLSRLAVSFLARGI